MKETRMKHTNNIGTIGVNGPIGVNTYWSVAGPHLDRLVQENRKVMEQLAELIFRNVKKGQSLFVFGSGHSSLFPMELYHRAGGVSFIIPLVAEFLLPSAGPPFVRALERTTGIAPLLLQRAEPKKGEMIWIASQSGINGAVIDMALAAKERGLKTVAFTSVVHSSSVQSRHPSKRRLFEICDYVVDLGGKAGDAAIPLNNNVAAGPLSSLGMITLGHSILVAAASKLEKQKIRCVYTSVNTPDGEKRNRDIEGKARIRDFFLR